MACPRWASEGVVKHSGCLNGGGQIKPEKREDMMLIAEKLKALYVKDGRACDLERVRAGVRRVYEELGLAEGSEELFALFHTRFHIIPEITVNSLHW